MMALLRHAPPPSPDDDLLLRPTVPTTPTATVATFAPTADAASKETDRPFQCAEPGCGRRFNRKFTLSEHMKTHTGEKPYMCPVAACSKRFSTSGNLARHKRLHASIKPFECSIDGCKRSFPNELKLQQHLKIHLGGKTHMCKTPGCGKSFSTAGNLTRHMKNHHHGADSRAFYHQNSPVSVANPQLMVGEQYAAYAPATHVPLTSYASLSGPSTPPIAAYSHAPATNLYYGYSQTESSMSMPPYAPRGAMGGYPQTASYAPPLYDELQGMPTLPAPDAHPQNLFDDVIQFQLTHPRMV